MTLQVMDKDIPSTNDVLCRSTIKDSDIANYQYLMIDIDTNKHGNKCASEEEIRHTLAFSKEFVHSVYQIVQCKPMIVFTGNGIQLLYPVTLANNKDNCHLIKSVLKSLSSLYSNDHAHIDHCVYNPARLCRIAGTMNWSDYECDQNGDRKNRRSKVLDYGNGTLLDIAALSKKLCLTEQRDEILNYNREYPKIDVQKTLDACNVKIVKEKTIDNGNLYVLESCPFNADHHHSSYVIQFNNGYMLFRCFHETCNHEWRDFCRMFHIDNTNNKKKTKKTDAAAETKEPTSKRLLNTLLENNRFFCDIKNDCYCQPLEIPNKVIHLNSSEFILYAQNTFFKLTGFLAKREDTNTVLPILLSEADGNHLNYEIRKRFAIVDGDIYYDLANPLYEVEKISKHKISITNDIGFPLFERSKAMLEQVYQPMEDTCDNLLDLLEPHFNLNEDQRFIFAVYLCTLYLDIPCACLIISGNAGSGKSRLFELLARLVNPSTNNLMSMPSKNNDLIVTVASNPVNIFDNLNSSSITQSKSDLMCKIISGNVAESNRLLYSNGETYVHKLSAKLMLNGLGLGGLRADLADRCIELRLNRISTTDRLDEESLNNAFEKDRVRILHAVFLTLQKMLTIKESIKPPYKLRLATWSDYSYFIAESIMGGGGEKWLSLIEKSNEEMNYNLLEDTPVASAIKSIMKDKKELEISVTELFKLAKKEAIALGFSKDDFPQASHVFSSKLTELEPLLKDLYGITYKKRNVGRYKQLLLHSKE